MLNQVLLVGHVDTIDDTKFTLEFGQLSPVTVLLPEGLVGTVKTYLKPQTVVGIKGHIQMDKGTITLVAEKVSFIQPE